MLDMLWNWIVDKIPKGLDGVGCWWTTTKALCFTIKCNNTDHQTFWISRLFHNNHQFFFCDNLLFVHFEQTFLLAYILKAFSHRASDSFDMFSFNSHPTLPIFILNSITFGSSRDSFCTLLLSDACCHPTDLCQSWRMAVLFSAWIAVLVALYVFKSTHQTCVKDVWTTQPSNSSIHFPVTSRAAISLSQWFVMQVALSVLIIYVYVHWYAPQRSLLLETN